MNAFETYLIFQLDSINLGITTLMVFIVVAMIVAALCNIGPDQHKTPVMVRKLTTAFLVLMVIAVMLPSTKTAIAMLVIPPITQNDEAKKIPGKLIDLLNRRLDELIPRDRH